MRFNNKTFIMIILLIGIMLIGAIVYLDKRIEYKVLMLVTFIAAIVTYVIAIFEYYEVKEDRLVHVNILTRKRKEVLWKDIYTIYMRPDGFFKAIRIRDDVASEIVINNGVKDYKDLVKIVLNETKNNSKLDVHFRVLEILE